MARTKMWRAGSSGRRPPGDAGFTLFELLIVMTVMALAFVAVSAFSKGPSAGAQVKSAARQMASRLRDLRAAAMTTGSERVATIDVNGRAVRFSDGRDPLEFSSTVAITVTGAESERSSGAVSGVRFFPNGSSSGATIQLKSERQAYEVRINWLTGRVSTAVLD
jgi:general secretion pathway protein H